MSLTLIREAVSKVRLAEAAQLGYHVYKRGKSVSGPHATKEDASKHMKDDYNHWVGYGSKSEQKPHPTATSTKHHSRHIDHENF